MVTIGITTYNRKNILEIMANSLYKSDLSASHNIRIYDDCSTEYDKDFLEKLFPTAESIIVNKRNLRADKNMYQMYTDFLSTGDNYFFNADSDIIFNEQWLNIALELIEKTDGVLSLFNSNSHKPYKILDNTFCLKNTIGAAGVFFSRNRITKLLENFYSIEQVKSFDWQWSEYFTNNKIKIYCLNKSIVQHIGYDGQNSVLFFDIGRNYKIETIEDGQLMNDILELSIDKITIEIEKMKNNFQYCLKRCLVIIIKKIMPKTIFFKLKIFIKSKKKNV